MQERAAAGEQAGQESDVATSREALGRTLAAASLAAVSDAVIHCDAGGRIDFLNPSAEQLLAVAAAEAHGRPLHEVFPLRCARNGEPLRLDLARPFSSDEADDERQPALLRGEAPPRELFLLVLPLRRDGVLIGTVLVARDAGEQQRMRRQLQHEAEHDTLTGLANRRALERRLRELTGEASAGPHSVLFVDLDHFKAVNDQAGHAAGDELLRELAGRLRPLIRRGDMLARFGGDEFVMLLPDCGLEVAERIAESLRQTVDAFDFQWQGQRYRVTASVGALDFFSDEMDPEQLLGEVDAACYAAKRGGRNRVSTLSHESEGNAGGDAVEELRSWLQQAIESERLALDGQRLHALDPAQRSAPVELLLRLPLPDGDQRLRASQFLGLARQLRLLPRIDLWVLRQAWALLGQHPDLELQINVGEPSLRAVDYTDTLVGLLESDPSRASRLVLEVGEEGLVGGYPHSFELARRIDALGAGLAVDGFRGGMAAVESLRRVPLRQIKLDSRMVRAGALDLIDRAMVEATVRLAAAMGVQSVACGVEGERDLAWLRGSGVGWLQGFHLHEPEPIGQLLAS